jgi:hypothetical protein
MDTELEALRKSELRCKELEANYKTEEQIKTGIVETSPLILNNLPQNTETEVEYLNKIEEPNDTLAALRAAIDEKTSENISLQNEITLIQADRDREMEIDRDDETSEPEDLSLKLALAAGRGSAMPREEKAAKELSADKKLLYVKAPKNTGAGSQFLEKMIYAAPAADIKKKALGIAILFALGAAGILLAYNFF